MKHNWTNQLDSSDNPYFECTQCGAVTDNEFSESEECRGYRLTKDEIAATVQATDKPWAAPNLSASDRALEVVEELRFTNDQRATIVQQAIEAAEESARAAVRDTAPQVEWLPCDGRKHDCIDLYVTDGKNVCIIEQWADIPTWITHYAAVPPPVMPAPPKEDTP